MRVQNKNTLKVVTSLLVLGLLVSACGRRGALEAPPSSKVITTDEAGNKVEKSADKPDRPFILDGLL